VLVDERTQSMGEYLTMCVQAVPGSVVVGSQTAGADGNIAWISLPGDAEAPIGHGYIKISGLGVFYPDGAPTQRIGVRIDHRVAPTIEGVKAGRDEVLEKALEIIGKN
jgi:C-terminal processing protease CtpA/Prc